MNLSERHMALVMKAMRTAHLLHKGTWKLVNDCSCRVQSGFLSGKLELDTGLWFANQESGAIRLVVVFWVNLETEEITWGNADGHPGPLSKEVHIFHDFCMRNFKSFSDFMDQFSPEARSEQ